MHPAAKGEPLTLVATDVEGSTDLWEWDKQAMMEAISIHDQILRTHLTENHGYEVATEVSLSFALMCCCVVSIRVAACSHASRACLHELADMLYIILQLVSACICIQLDPAPSFGAAV